MHLILLAKLRISSAIILHYMHKNTLHNNSGLSLIELLITGAIATTLVVFVAKVASSVMKGKVKSDVSSSFIQVENAVIQTIARRMNEIAGDSTSATRCNGGGPGLFIANFTSDSLTLPGIGRIVPTTAINYPVNRRQDVNDAIGRCTSVIVPSAVGDINGENQPGAYYFCVQLDRGGIAPASNTAFFDSEAAFAEIRINLVNTSDALAVHSGPFLSCTNFRTNPSGGVVLYYKTYWRRTNDPTEFTQAGKVLLPR